MEIDFKQALQYLGAGDAPSGGETAKLVREEAQRLVRALTPRFLWRVFPLSHRADACLLPEAGLALPGRMADRMLSGCDACVLLACTLGAEFDQLLRMQERRDMSRAVVLDACASAYVEAGCDAAEQEIKARFPALHLTDRFSPGYADLPLTVQPALCAALDAQRRLGLHVTESLLLIPGKSVTAILGLSNTPQPRRIRGCASCSMAGSCTYRKGGITCAS